MVYLIKQITTVDLPPWLHFIFGKVFDQYSFSLPLSTMLLFVSFANLHQGELSINLQHIREYEIMTVYFLHCNCVLHGNKVANCFQIFWVLQMKVDAHQCEVIQFLITVFLSWSFHSSLPVSLGIYSILMNIFWFC